MANEAESASESLARLGVLRNSLRSMREASQLARANRVDVARAIVDRALEMSERSQSRCNTRRAATLDSSERALNDLVLRYRSVVSAEQLANSQRLAEADAMAKTEVAELETRTRLETFGAHVGHETKGAVTLRRLSPEDPQSHRCRRAATDNVRRGCKIPDVREVYKIENRVLLDAFRTLSNKKKVKGLFTTVPLSSLERIVTHGFRHVDTDDDCVLKLFEDDGGQGPTGPAKRTVTTSENVIFPRVFSRYSTTADVLVLCRVVVGSVVFADRAPEDASSQDVDSLYMPQTEEYKPLHPERVIPEFILICRHRPETTPTGDNQNLVRPAQPAQSHSHLLIRMKAATLDDDETSNRANKQRNLVEDIGRTSCEARVGSTLSPPSMNPSGEEDDIMHQPLPLLENEAIATREKFVENATAEKRAIIRALTDLVDTVLGSGGGGGGSEEGRRSSDKESGVGVFPSFSSAGWRRQARTGGPRRVAVS